MAIYNSGHQPDKDAGWGLIFRLNDLWEFNLENDKFVEIKLLTKFKPLGRSFSSLVLHNDNTLLLFGGFNIINKKERYYNDIHLFNLETLKWKQLKTIGTLPELRNRQTITKLSKQLMLLFVEEV